jgi:hypothetical protein
LGEVAMGSFEDVHADRIVGTLTMFDRMIFKGHLTRLFAPGAISAMLWEQGFPLKEFTRYATSTTERLTDNPVASRLTPAGLTSIWITPAPAGQCRPKRTWPAPSPSATTSSRVWCVC